MIPVFGFGIGPRQGGSLGIQNIGIDAKKTHVLILLKLNEIERRLRKLEEAG